MFHGHHLLIFFFWGYIKGKVDCNSPNNIQELKTNIIDEINMITPPVLESVNQNIARYANLLNNDGKHLLKNMILKQKN